MYQEDIRKKSQTETETLMSLLTLDNESSYKVTFALAKMPPIIQAGLLVNLVVSVVFLVVGCHCKVVVSKEQ